MKEPNPTPKRSEKRNPNALSFEDHDVRMVMEDGEPWWALPDVARALGLDVASGRMFLRSPRCKPSGVKAFYVSDGKQNRKTNFVNERNLYALIGQSNKPEALRFMDWVYDEVLPSIRKQGFYRVQDADEYQRLLSVFVPGELRPWKALFPEEFFEEMCRLNGWKYDASTHRTHPNLGRMIRDIVYDRLPAGVLEKLDELNPVDPLTGRRTWHHHQLLASEVAQHLKARIGHLAAMAKAEACWADFKARVNAVYPKPGRQMILPGTLSLPPTA
jgi:prophage antirepressor-like protein